MVGVVSAANIVTISLTLGIWISQAITSFRTNGQLSVQTCSTMFCWALILRWLVAEHSASIKGTLCTACTKLVLPQIRILLLIQDTTGCCVGEHYVFLYLFAYSVTVIVRQKKTAIVNVIVSCQCR